jgi:hypothetical protein
MPSPVDTRYPMPARRQSVGGSFAGSPGSPNPTISKISCDAGLFRSVTQALHTLRLLRALLVRATHERDPWQAATMKNVILCESGESYS